MITSNAALLSIGVRGRTGEISLLEANRAVERYKSSGTVVAAFVTHNSGVH